MPQLAALPAMARKLMPRVAVYLMLGFFLGFLFFYDMFPFFCVPASSDLPVAILILAVCAAGLISGYLFPDIIHVLTSSIAIPLAGAGFTALISSSPALSRDIVTYGVSEGFMALTILLMPYMLISFLIIFTTGFACIYVFEEQ